MLKTIAQHLSDARKVLIAADIDGSALDARLLLQVVCDLTHEQIIAEPEKIVTEIQAAVFQSYLNRRLLHEPISRILGLREFYGREFVVTPAVLDPRADTEALIELIINSLRLDPRLRGDDGLGGLHILDIGTGSGAIIITLLAELPTGRGLAVDLSIDALLVAKKNALRNGVSGRLYFHHGSWFEGVTGTFDLIVSNPPYIPQAEIATLETDVKDYDPHLALDGGGDGLYAYRALASGAADYLKVDGFIVVEIGAGQASDVTDIFARHNFKFYSQRVDLGGHVRALAFQAC
jgi:release factor glutamine methyltransferase